MGVPGPARLFRFGAFQLDLRSRELRRNGIKVRVPDQSVQVLAMLLEHPGEVVTREEVHQRLWPNGTIVEFDHSINAAIMRLRQALEDSAEAPRYVETLPRLGYRFIGTVEEEAPLPEAAASVQEPQARLISHYRILEKIGSGGMGVVYKAEDTRLHRTVAIKVLSEHLSDSPQIRERFEREARAIASLNHPHICTVHDVGQQDGTDFLVMEYLEGETLADRLQRGPLSLDLVLQYGIQISSALDAAHKRDVIHRDLKPGNLMLTKSGVKLLDFGLAKIRKPIALSGATASLTDAAPLTGEGAILGTLQYMAPEQLDGKEADARTDIFALGAVIYEMATGTRAFGGTSQASVVSAIMTVEPPSISTLQSMSPPELDHIVRTCLAKDPDARWQNAHDVMIGLKWVAESSAAQPAVSRSTRREMVAWTCAAAASVAAAGVAAWNAGKPRLEALPMHFTIPAPSNTKFLVDEYGPFVAVSPNGQKLVWVGLAGGKQMLYLRPLDSPAVKMLPGTENARMPFWSPDNRSVGFFANGRLKTAHTVEGTVNDLCDASIGLGGAWNRDGLIVFSPSYGQPMHRISAAGGEPAPCLDLDKASGETAQLTPSFLPDGRQIIYQSWRKSKHVVCIGSMESRRTRALISDADQAMYVLPGWLVFHSLESILAQPFDAGNLRLTGEPRRLADRASFCSVSDTGVLAYRGIALSTSQLRWYSRDGKGSAPVVEGDQATMSRDGQQLGLERGAQRGGGSGDIWILESANGVMTRVTFKGGWAPLFSPDGRQLIFTSYQKDRYCLYRKVIATGEEELLFTSDEPFFANDWSRDGAFVVLVWGMALARLKATGEHKVEVLLKTDYDKDSPRLSPDERWIAYQSAESGRWQVYVTDYPGFSRKRQVSNAGGCQPRWRGDGKELFYLSPDDVLMAVDMSTGATLESGSPRVVFQTRIRGDSLLGQYNVAKDGQRFLIAEPLDDEADTITVVVNWGAGLQR